ncbi:MAG TPA: ATP-binding cassette domain-containing protein, partial [Chitinophagaceae bacterium]|nr:ATP-binding cassette domain-containing protein [Chitinophagaceae bacterium]
GWIKFFLRYRRELDYKNFSLQSTASSETLQLVQGMQEIKLNNAEQLRRWNWEKLQAGIFKLSFTRLSITQYQQVGSFFINEGKNIFITFFVAQAVVNGSMTLGAMVAIQYIIGQLNAPLEQLIGFVQSAQDARISLGRLNEIHQLREEEQAVTKDAVPLIHHLPANRSLTFTNVSFTYAGAGNEPVLRSISLKIPAGKTTAIVGMSGSGKTTLLKLLLKFYDSYSGEICIGNTDLAHISPWYWRSQCGAVMQDGYIFNDSIAGNIAVNEQSPDHERLTRAARIANIHSFINSLPLGFNTKIGMEGNGISAGQRQRILIARAVYKDPQYIFFDEATNALDADNEKMVMENLGQFLQGRTAVIVAHRLSTVKNADNIIVL